MSNKKKNIIICFYLVILILISGISFVVIAIKKRKDSSGDEMRETNKIDQLELNKNKIKESIYEFHQNEFFHKDKTKTKAYLNDFEFLRSYLEKNPDQFLKDRFNKIEKEINDFDTLIQNFFHLCLDIKNNNNSYVQKEIDFYNQEFKAVVSKIKENMKVNNFDFLEKLGNVKNIVFKDKIDQLESNKNKIKKNIYEFYQNKTKTKAYLNDFEFFDSYFKEDDYYNFGFDYFQEKINQKLRFHQIEKEINDFDVVIKNFFNLYLDINNKNNNSNQEEIDFYNREFNNSIFEIDEKIKTNNFDFLEKLGNVKNIVFKYKIDQLESNKNKIKKNIYEFYQNKTKAKTYLNDFEFLHLYLEKNPDQFLKDKFNKIEKEINDFDVVIKNFFNLYLDINNKNNNSNQEEIDFYNREFNNSISEMDEKIKTNNFDFLEKLGNVKNIVFKYKIDQLESNKNKIKKNIYEFYQNDFFHKDETKTKAYLNDFEFLDSYFKEDDYYNFGFDYFQEKINQKLRFHQIEKEINDFDVVIKNFFNLYLDINNKNNNYGLVDINDNSYQKEISLKNKFNQEFTAVVSEIDEKMKTNNFDFLRKMEKLQLIFKVFKNNNIDFRYSYNSIIKYVEENFYGQIELISSFTSFIKKKRSFKMIFALVGCPSSGKTTFVKTFTEGLNSVMSEHYCFKKISVFDVLQQEFLDLDFHSNLVSYIDYFSFYLLKQIAACEYKMVVLFDLDQVPNRFLDFLITLNDENSFLFQNLIIFLSFSSRYYRLSSQFSNVFKVNTNTMQTYSMNHIFNIFNHAIIPKKVDEVKNHIFSLLKKNKIFNDDEGDDELKAEIFENFDITVYETRFLYHFISFFQNKNKAKDFDSKCHCVIITSRKLEKLADKIINMLTGDIIKKLSNEQITKDEVLDVLNFKKTLKMDEYQEFMEKERDIAMGNRDKNCQ